MCRCSHLYLATCDSDVVEQAALKEGLNGPNGPNIILVFASLDEGNEPGRVQMCCVMILRRRLRVIEGGMCSFSVYHTSRLEPGLLQAGRRGGPSFWLTLKQQADKVPGSWAHTLEVVLREAEVQATDVQTCLLQTLVQEGRGAAEQHIGHHPCKKTKSSPLIHKYCFSNKVFKFRNA